MKRSQVIDDDRNIFVLVDESHRSQTGRYGGHSRVAVKMRRMLPNACYLGFTGTPLLKKERSTLSSFGRLIHHYTINEAVADQAVVPLLYEGRLVQQQVTGEGIDRWFDKISVGLSDNQKTDLKRKFSRMDALAKTDQAIRASEGEYNRQIIAAFQGSGDPEILIVVSKLLTGTVFMKTATQSRRNSLA